MERPDQSLRALFHLHRRPHDYSPGLPLLCLSHSHSPLGDSARELRDPPRQLPHPVCAADNELLEDHLHRCGRGSLRAGRGVGRRRRFSPFPFHLPPPGLVNNHVTHIPLAHRPSISGSTPTPPPGKAISRSVSQISELNLANRFGLEAEVSERVSEVSETSPWVLPSPSP